MKLRLLAAFAAVALMLGISPSIDTSPTGERIISMSSAAYAAEGKWGKRIRMASASREDIVATFTRGDEPCVGSDKNHTCYNLDPVLNELHIQWVSRPVGANKNVVVNSIVSLDGSNAVLRNEAGVVLARFQVGSEQQNAAAIWTTALGNMLPALANGMGAAGVQAIANPCGGGRCGGGGSVAYAISGSEANAVLQGALGGCTTCTAPKP